MANRVKSTLFWPLEKFRVSARDWRLTGTFSNRLNTRLAILHQQNDLENYKVGQFDRNNRNSVWFFAENGQNIPTLAVTEILCSRAVKIANLYSLTELVGSFITCKPFIKPSPVIGSSEATSSPGLFP